MSTQLPVTSTSASSRSGHIATRPPVTSFFLADLHFGDNEMGDLNVRTLAAHLNLRARAEDRLYICGDIADTDKKVAECLDLFRSFPGPKLAVLGNHDVRIVDPKSTRTSQERFQHLNSFVLPKCGFHSLDTSIYRFSDTEAAAGTMGWYDWTFVPLTVHASRYRENPEVWSHECRAVREELNAIKWQGRRDEQIAKTFSDELKWALQNLKDVPELTIITHVLPTRRLLPIRGLRDLILSDEKLVAQGMMGCESLSSVIEAETWRQTRRTVVSGHSHYAAHAKMEKNGDYYTVGSTAERKEMLIIQGGGRAIREFAG